EAQLFSNLIGQSNASYRYGPSQKDYADKNIFDWVFDQTRASEESEADKDALNNLIAQAETFKAEDYTTESFHALLAALEAAKQVSADKAATQDEVDDAAAALNGAIDNLVRKSSDTNPPDDTN